MNIEYQIFEGDKSTLEVGFDNQHKGHFRHFLPNSKANFVKCGEMRVSKFLIVTIALGCLACLAIALGCAEDSHRALPIRAILNSSNGKSTPE